VQTRGAPVRERGRVSALPAGDERRAPAAGRCRSPPPGDGDRARRARACSGPPCAGAGRKARREVSSGSPTGRDGGDARAGRACRRAQALDLRAWGEGPERGLARTRRAARGTQGNGQQRVHEAPARASSAPRRARSRPPSERARRPSRMGAGRSSSSTRPGRTKTCHTHRLASKRSRPSRSPSSSPRTRPSGCGRRIAS
jgi:hypothetical protein